MDGLGVGVPSVAADLSALQSLKPLRGASTIISLHGRENGAKKDSMPCLMSHRKSAVKQGTKQIFQVLGL